MTTGGGCPQRGRDVMHATSADGTTDLLPEGTRVEVAGTGPGRIVGYGFLGSAAVYIVEPAEGSWVRFPHAPHESYISVMVAHPDGVEVAGCAGIVEG